MVQIEPIVPRDDEELASRLLALQMAAYQVEARLIGDDRIPPLHEVVGDVRSAPVSWLGAFDGDRLVGAIAYTVTDNGLDIDRLVVEPELFRQGIGTALVGAVLDLADGREVTVSTGKGNAPAAALYLAHRFLPAGDIEVIPTLWVSQFVRPAGPGPS